MSLRLFTIIAAVLTALGASSLLVGHARAKDSQQTLQTQIAQVEAEVDTRERAALAQASHV
jgi:hypothetical protein